MPHAQGGQNFGGAGSPRARDKGRQGPRFCPSGGEGVRRLFGSRASEERAYRTGARRQAQCPSPCTSRQFLILLLTDVEPFNAPGQIRPPMSVFRRWLGCEHFIDLNMGACCSVHR